MEPAILVLKEVKLNYLDAEEQHQIRIHQDRGCKLLNIQHNDNFLNPESISEIFRPSNRRDTTQDVHAPLTEAMFRLFWVNVLFVSVSILTVLFLVVAGTIVGRTTPSLMSAGFILVASVTTFPPLKLFDKERESWVYFALTWPFLIIGNTFLTISTMISASSNWYIVSIILSTISVIMRLTINSVETNSLGKLDSNYVDVDHYFQSFYFSNRGKITFAGILVFIIVFHDLFAPEGESIFSSISAIEMLAYFILIFLGSILYFAAIWKIPISKIGRSASIFLSMTSAMFFSISIFAIQIAFETDNHVSWIGGYILAILGVSSSWLALSSLNNEARFAIKKDDGCQFDADNQASV